jgi:hypothetical protein
MLAVRSIGESFSIHTLIHFKAQSFHKREKRARDNRGINSSLPGMVVTASVVALLGHGT